MLRSHLKYLDPHTYIEEIHRLSILYGSFLIKYLLTFFVQSELDLAFSTLFSQVLLPISTGDIWKAKKLLLLLDGKPIVCLLKVTFDIILVDS